jgi:hypothetical protein
MVLGIARPILALAVELICRLLDYISIGRPGLLAMGVDAVLQPDIDLLRVLARDGSRAGDVIGPFGIDDDIAVAEPHLGVDERSLGIADHHAALEAEGCFEPVQRGTRSL